VYELPVRDFITDSGGRSYTEVKKLCRELGGTFAETEGRKNGKPVFKVFPFFERIEYHDGIIKAVFNKGMSPMLIALKTHFTKYNLLEYLKLPSVYSQRMFEILKSWNSEPEVEIPLSELHRMLTTPVSFRANFFEFRRRVLEKAHKDITEKTKLRYEWEPIKKGRRIAAIRFTFGPGRKALAEAAAQQKAEAERKAKEEKKSIAVTKAAAAAAKCARAKSSRCVRQDNRKGVCAVCVRMNLCGDTIAFPFTRCVD
jgi:plasmid replication initiation protein